MHTVQGIVLLGSLECNKKFTTNKFLFHSFLSKENINSKVNLVTNMKSLCPSRSLKNNDGKKQVNRDTHQPSS